jgi:hypothetical protein
MTASTWPRAGIACLKFIPARSSPRISPADLCPLCFPQLQGSLSLLRQRPAFLGSMGAALHPEAALSPRRQKTTA